MSYKSYQRESCGRQNQEYFEDRRFKKKHKNKNRAGERGKQLDAISMPSPATFLRRVHELVLPG